MSAEEVDSLDAYMATLELPSGGATASMAQARAEHFPSPSTSCGRAVVVKNRRYRRLQQLLQETTDGEDQYFSDAMMQQRSPALFHFYLGQYLGLEKGPTASPAADEGGQKLSSFLMDTCQRSEMEARRVAEQETWGKFTAADERQEQERVDRLYEEENVVEEEEEEEEDEEEATAFTVAERRLQLIDIMTTRFLNGNDGEYVSYAEIDADESLDDFDEMQRDAENRYFADGAEEAH
ncbi:unnamed protein product [Phytophthora fragariaefolia]|uniref:Unnamed protein product n=1 Tax=Phytophthora fragariaefolia TaxID=1490495 RepID=A0A9W7CSS8_9STRA|nr:unnamed protein product [Phytophthora fragariaefolia]